MSEGDSELSKDVEDFLRQQREAKEIGQTAAADQEQAEEAHARHESVESLLQRASQDLMKGARGTDDLPPQDKLGDESDDGTAPRPVKPTPRTPQPSLNAEAPLPEPEPTGR